MDLLSTNEGLFLNVSAPPAGVELRRKDIVSFGANAEVREFMVEVPQTAPKG
jgi:hypothetical protein